MKNVSKFWHYLPWVVKYTTPLAFFIAAVSGAPETPTWGEGIAGIFCILTITVIALELYGPKNNS